MNKYDEFFEFRLATIQDIDMIMEFLKREWGANHILANDKEFFLWQYGNEQYSDTKSINFVLMIDKEKNIVGVNGFVTYSSELNERYVSSTITKVKNDLPLPLCGVELIKRFKRLVPAKAYYSSGTNPKTMLPLGKKIFHYTTGMMQQYYLLNQTVDNYEIAQIRKKIKEDYVSSDCSLKKVKSIRMLEEKFDFNKKFPSQAYKSKEYVEKRFFNHPVYEYKIWGIYKDSSRYSGVLIGREIKIGERKILRFVDYLGDIEYLGKIGSALEQLMQEEQYEYIDLMAGTLPEGLMRNSGFILRKADDENIIPTYFEPFVQENINIYFQKSVADIVIFKADGDQDRPNKR